MIEVVADEEVFTGMEEEVVNANASRDMFEESVNEEPYRLSQVGAGVATQTALALSISEASFNEHLCSTTGKRAWGEKPVFVEPQDRSNIY